MPACAARSRTASSPVRGCSSRSCSFRRAGGPSDRHTPSGLHAWIQRAGLPSPVADGPDGLRAKVREFVQAGADVIKVFATGHLSMPRDGARRSMFTDRSNMASTLDGVALDAMASAGTYLVPTLLASAAMLEMGDDAPAGASAVVAGHRAVVREAHRRGIPIAMGTDCPVTPHGRNAEELALMVECGLSPAEALTSATSVAARLLGLEDEIGCVAVGLRADMLVIDGDPFVLTNFKPRIHDVFQGGVRVGPSGTT